MLENKIKHAALFKKKKIELKCLNPEKEMIILWCDGGVSQCCSGNYLTTYKYIRSSPCTP